jgi:hypothetical protein
MEASSQDHFTMIVNFALGFDCKLTTYVPGVKDIVTVIELLAGIV